MPQITSLDMSRLVPSAVYWLAKPNKSIIGKLKHVYNDSFQKRIADMNTLNLSIPFYIDDEYLHTNKINPHVENMKEHYLIKMVFNGDTFWFKINNLTKQSTDSGDVFEVKCLSLESELRGKKIRNYTVESKNCTQVLTTTLDSTLWTISSVDASFDLTYRDFDVSYKSAIEFIQTDLVEAFENSVVTFDTVNRTVSIVLESSLEKDMGFRIKFGKYMTSFSKDSQMDDIVTRMIGVGNDELSIATVTENGYPHIDDFGYYMEGYIEEPLLTSLTNYNTLLSTKKPTEQTAEIGTTTTTLKLTAHNLTVGSYIVNRSRGRETRKVLTVPDANTVTISAITNQVVGDTILKYNSSTFRKLLFELEDLQADLLVKETALTDLLTAKTIILNTLSIQHSASTIDSYVNTITNTSVTRTLSGLSASDRFVTLAKISTTTGTTVTVNGVSKSFLANTWSVLAKVTGTVSHNIVITTTGTNISVRTMIVKLTESEYATSGNESTIIEKYSDDAKQIQIDAKQAEINTINTNITSKNSEITTFRTSVSYETNFTVSELNELKLYTYVGEYRNENIIDPKDLYDLTLEELNKVNSPAILYNTGISNFLASVTEQKNWDKMDIHYTAKVIHDRLGIDVSVKITEIEYDFENTNINLTIASDKKILSREERVAKDYFDSINTTKKINAKLSDIQNQKNNFSTRNDRISTVPATPVLNTDLTALEHRINNNGSVDIYFTWEYSAPETGDAYDIDGFYIYTYSSSTDSVYVFGSTSSRQDFKIVKPTERVFALQGQPSDKFYTFGIQAFRIVDTDINSDSILKSTIVQPTSFSENPYQPETSISLNGDFAGTIDGVSATTVANATTNFNTRNDRLSTTPANPTIANDGTAIDHTLNTDSTSNISFEWIFTGSGDSYDVDGFIIYTYQSTSSSAYVFGTDPSNEQVYNITNEKRAFLLYGVPSNKYYTFGVRAYRNVDDDINSSGVLMSSIVKSTFAGENPYIPSSTVAFSGDLTGTVDGTSATTVVTNSTNGQTSYTQTANSIRNGNAISAPTITSDGTAIDHVINTDGSSDISFEWSFTESGTSPIDGFGVVVYSSTPNVAHTPTLASDTVLYFDKSSRSYISYGVPADKYYTFGVFAYRIVDTTIDASGIIRSSIVKPSLVAEDPYQPSTSVAFTGDVTGTIGGVAYNAISKTAGTFIVADGSTSTNVNRADYVVPVASTSAQTTINTAISALGLGGGEIVLLDGTYIVDGSITVPSNVSIKGQGNSTIVKIKDSYNTSINVFVNSDVSTGNSDINLSNFKIDGNKANNSLGSQRGIFFDKVTDCLVSNIFLVNFRSGSITIKNGLRVKVNNNFLNSGFFGVTLDLSTECTISSNTIEGSGFVGLYVTNSERNTINGNTIKGTGVSDLGIDLVTSSNNTIGNNTVTGTGSDGILIYSSSNNNALSANTTTNNKNNGINISLNSNHNTVIGNISRLNLYHGIYIGDAHNNIISNNICLENRQHPEVLYTADNIRVADGDYNNIQNNICRRGTLTLQPKYGINIATIGSVGNIVTNNDLYQSGATGSFSDSGTSTISTSGNRL